MLKVSLRFSILKPKKKPVMNVNRPSILNRKIGGFFNIILNIKDNVEKMKVERSNKAKNPYLSMKQYLQPYL